MPHRFDPTILREYDIRGIVGTTLFPADANALGRLFAQVLAEAGGRRAAVGYDGRLTSPEFEAALFAGLAEGGADVVRIGRGPTPMLYYAAATLGVDGGIMVTGSHHPPADGRLGLRQRGHRRCRHRSRATAAGAPHPHQRDDRRHLPGAPPRPDRGREPRAAAAEGEGRGLRSRHRL